ncbi:quinone oxidoreductase [Sphingopyxis sp. J-6]|uniref:quinone oxidoreductase family protein n=1 Tax=Sphingopyxis sp. J-6 TaxID=3122054 RepID=UPI0039840767
MSPSSNRVILLSEYGGAERLRIASMQVPPLAAGEIRLRQTAIGVNYHDVYVRSGLYKTLPLPGIPGIEAVGYVEDVAPDVTDFRVGDRVGYVAPAYGGYAECRNLPADRAVRIPGGLMSDVEAAATLMKSLTAHVLLRQVHALRAGDKILVHAAAGGMGQLLCRWASHLGATVVGTVGSVEKAAIAREAGAAHVVLYREEDVAARVFDITAGRGADVVYDAVGADTFAASMASLAFCGHLVNYGQASGPVEPVALGALATRSLSLSRPIVFHYLRDAASLAAMARDVFEALGKGYMKPITPMVLPFEAAARAHEILESRQSPGGIVLIP